MNFSFTPHFNNEQQLLEGCRKANPLAQQAMYSQYAKSLMLLCLRYVGNEENAKELLTDSFVAAFQNFSKFEYKSKENVQAWLKRIAINQCLMHLRQKKIQFVEINEVIENAEGGDEINAAMNAKEIMKRINSLPLGYRTVFNLYVFEEMKHKEIAALLHISENTSKTQLHKARLLLQKQLLKE